MLWKTACPCFKVSERALPFFLTYDPRYSYYRNRQPIISCIPPAPAETLYENLCRSSLFWSYIVSSSSQSDTSGFTKKGFSVTTPSPVPKPEPRLESKPSVAVTPEAAAAATTAATVVAEDAPSATEPESVAESKSVTESEESVTVPTVAKESESVKAVTESVEPAESVTESVTESVESVVVVTEEDLELEEKKSQILSEALSGVVEEVEAASDDPKGMDNGMLQVFLSPALPPTSIK